MTRNINVDVQLTMEQADWLCNHLSDCFRNDNETPKHQYAISSVIAEKIQEAQQQAIEEDENPAAWDPDSEEYDDWDPKIDFADPGGNSALRAETPDNPRNLPCPTCGEPNRLTPKDRALGYQCDQCADALERGGP